MRSPPSVRAARPSSPGRMFTSGSATRPMRRATSIRSSSSRRSRTAVQRRAIQQHRSQARAAVRRPRPHRSRARRLRRAPPANPPTLARGAGACRPAGDRPLRRPKAAVRVRRSSARKSSRIGLCAGPRKRRPCGPCVRRTGEFAWTGCRRALCDGRLSSRRLPSSRAVSTPATRSGRMLLPRSRRVHGRRRPPCRCRWYSTAPRPCLPSLQRFWPLEADEFATTRALSRPRSFTCPGPGDTSACVARCLRSCERAPRPRSRRLV